MTRVVHTFTTKVPVWSPYVTPVDLTAATPYCKRPPVGAGQQSPQASRLRGTKGAGVYEPDYLEAIYGASRVRPRR